MMIMVGRSINEFLQFQEKRHNLKFDRTLLKSLDGACHFACRA